MNRPVPRNLEAGYAPGFVDALLRAALAGDDGPAVLAITGVQGSGKSTLAAQLVAAARAQDIAAVAMSIDDFYLGRRERLALGRRVHPLLATRGPPGTHEVALACEVLDALGAGRLARIPRFDKIADRRLPPSRWRVVRRPPRLVVFEGWFLRVPAEPAAALREPINALEREQDRHGIWRRYVNASLARDYAPLWARLSRLLFLQAPGFEVVREWRWQQERTLQAAHPDRRAMDRAQVERFILFFERVSRQALRTLPAIAGLTIPLSRDRTPLIGPDAPPGL